MHNELLTMLVMGGLTVVSAILLVIRRWITFHFYCKAVGPPYVLVGPKDCVWKRFLVKMVARLLTVLLPMAFVLPIFPKELWLIVVFYMVNIQLAIMLGTTADMRDMIMRD